MSDITAVEGPFFKMCKRAGLADAAGRSYLFRELWTTASAAPVTSPRVCEPGPGTITITGTDQSISGGRFVCPNNAGTQGFVRTDAAITKADGIALIFKNVRRTGAIASSGSFGWRTAANLGATSGGGLNISSVGVRTNLNGGVGLLAGALTQDVDYDFAVICRTNGVYLLYKLSSASLWTLLFVDDILSGTTLYPVVQLTSTPSQWGQVLALQSWLIPRLYYSASGVIGTVTLPTADFVAKVRCTGTGTVGIKYRIQDANNYWRAERTATAIRIIETIAGVDQAAAATSAITAATNDRIILAVEGTSHRLWHQVSAGTTIVTPTAFTSGDFQTATGLEITDEANYSELEVFNRTQYGVAA